MEELQTAEYRQLEFTVKNRKGSNGETPVFVAPIESIREQREKTRDSLRGCISMATVVMDPRPNHLFPDNQAVIDDPNLKLGLSVIASFAKELSWDLIRNAGFRSRKDFYDQSIQWAGEEWWMKVSPIYGIDLLEANKSDQGRKIFELTSKRYGDAFHHVSDTHQLFPATVNR